MFFKSIVSYKIIKEIFERGSSDLGFTKNNSSRDVLRSLVNFKQTSENLRLRREAVTANLNFIKENKDKTILTSAETNLVFDAITESLRIYKGLNTGNFLVVSHAKATIDGQLTAITGANMQFGHDTSAINFICSEQALITSANTTSPNSEQTISTIVVVTIGQDKPLQVCPKCRIMATKCDKNLKFILLSLDPSNGNIIQLGTHGIQELLPSIDNFKLPDQDNEEFEKKEFEKLVNKVLAISREDIPVPITKSKQPEIAKECGATEPVIVSSTVIFKYPGDSKPPLSNIVTLGDGYYALISSFEVVKGSSPSESPATKSYHITQSHLDEMIEINPEISFLGMVNFRLLEGDTKQVVKFDSSIVGLLLTHLENGIHSKFFVGLPSVGGAKYDIGEITNLHPKSSVDVLYRNKP